MLLNEKWKHPREVQPVVKVHLQILTFYNNLNLSVLVNESII